MNARCGRAMRARSSTGQLTQASWILRASNFSTEKGPPARGWAWLRLADGRPTDRHLIADYVPSTMGKGGRFVGTTAERQPTAWMIFLLQQALQVASLPPSKHCASVGPIVVTRALASTLTPLEFAARQGQLWRRRWLASTAGHYSSIPPTQR